MLQLAQVSVNQLSGCSCFSTYSQLPVPACGCAQQGWAGSAAGSSNVTGFATKAHALAYVTRFQQVKHIKTPVKVVAATHSSGNHAD